MAMDFLNELVQSEFKARRDPTARLNLRIGEQYVFEGDVRLDHQRLAMIKKLKKLIKAEKAAADSDQDILDSYKDLLKSYRKMRVSGI